MSERMSIRFSGCPHVSMVRDGVAAHDQIFNAGGVEL
jgi:hypothetical protein